MGLEKDIWTEGRDQLFTLVSLAVPHVCSPVVALLHKMCPFHRRQICANSLWLYFYFTHTLPSKNKNINYIFMYLRILRCLSCSSIYNKANYQPSLKLSKLDEPDIRNTPGEVRTNSCATYSCGPDLMDE